MKNKIYRLITISLLAIIGCLGLISPVLANSGNSNNNVFGDPCRHDPGSPICRNQNPVKMEILVKNGLNLLMWIAGILAVVMIIYAGYLFVRSSNDSSKITSAKNIILYAVIGLIVIAAANVIVAFVIKTVE